MSRNWETFKCSIFFVLGFSLVFSIVGVLLQTILTNVGYTVQEWLGRIGGAIIILFGLYFVGLIRPKFLEKEHQISIKRKFSSSYLTSFVFGAAFAVGWSPCVSAALGAILALAATNPSSGFILLLAYTLGLGIPFLLVGLFTTQAQGIINKAGKWIKYLQLVFGVLLILIGILVFVNQLSRVANLQFAVNIIEAVSIQTSGTAIMSLNLVNVGIAFFAGLISFLSPCVLPLIPGFLTYLASVSLEKKDEN
ncbi:cytochrome C biogenesis protein [Candidatus Woesearchaeota archaeon CG10_big_fil_rev_8_21_14_0_10_34_8]|nr:MAG: cytochrome C biogenesis protein [Candidatus Woesearchaeota archaeon CG10_big_fil_rev_8_21_14_0_10_34_8]